MVLEQVSRPLSASVGLETDEAALSEAGRPEVDKPCSMNGTPPDGQREPFRLRTVVRTTPHPYRRWYLTGCCCSGCWRLLHPSDQRDFAPNVEAALANASASSTWWTRSSLRHAFLTEGGRHNTQQVHHTVITDAAGEERRVGISFTLKIILQHFKASQIRAEGVCSRLVSSAGYRRSDCLKRNQYWLKAGRVKAGSAERPG